MSNLKDMLMWIAGNTEVFETLSPALSQVFVNEQQLEDVKKWGLQAFNTTLGTRIDEIANQAFVEDVEGLEESTEPVNWQEEGF